MTARSPYIRRWQDTFPIAIPRSRLNVGLTRRHMLIVLAALYLGVLVFIYLHLLGQVALIQYKTVQTHRQWQQMLEENARLETQLAPYLSVAYIAQMSEGFEPIPVTHVTSAQATAQGANAEHTVVRAGRSQNFTAAWARVFHLSGGPSQSRSLTQRQP